MSESEVATSLEQEALLNEVQPMEDNSLLEDKAEPESSELTPLRNTTVEFSTATTTDEEKGDERVRHASVNSDDLLYEDSLAETKPHLPGSAADDVLLELNSEEQEQFEVIDMAGGGQESHNSMETSESMDKEETNDSKAVDSRGGMSSEVDHKSGSQNYSPSSSASGGKNSKSRERDISPIVFKKKDNLHESEKSSKPSKERSSCGSHRITDKLFSNTRYFVIKSNNFDNVEIAKTRNVWSTPPYNEKKLNKAYRDCRNVLLIFSVRESGRFQGIARLMSESRHDSHHVPWVLPPGISQSQLGGIFKLDWIHKGAVEFSVCMDLKNPWNDNKPVKISRDGQEVEPTVGEKLCRLWQNVEGDEGVLSGGRSSGSRGDGRHSSSSGHGSVGSSSGPFPPKGQPHMFQTPPMYFPYHQSMHQSVYPGSSGDSRNPMAMSAFFSQPPRLGFSSPTHQMPPALHPMGGAGGGAYSRPGRPWWTVPTYPPPTHLHHHPHQPHGVPLTGNDFHEINAVQDDPASTTTAAEQPPPPIGAESPLTPPKTVVPRTSSRNAYSQQRQSILKKQQQQALKAGKKLDPSSKSSKNYLFSDEESRISPVMKTMRVTDGAHGITKDEHSEPRRGIKSKEENIYAAKRGANCKHHLSQAEALLDSHKRRKLDHSKERSSNSRSKGHHHSSRSEGSSSKSTRSPVSSSSYRTVVEREHKGERSSHSEKSRKSKTSKKEKEKRKDRKRSRSRSSSSSFEDDFGVKKETLLHGSYADYLKEYSSKGSTKGNVPTMADLAAAYQKALTRVASALQHQSSSSKVDSKAYSKRVDEFLAKAHSKSS